MAGPLTGFGQEPGKQLARRTQRGQAGETGHPSGDRGRLHRSDRAASDEHRLVVFEIVTPGTAEQGMRPLDDACVRGSHDERSHPLTRLGILLGTHHVGLLRPGAHVGGREGIRIGEHLAELGVVADLLDQVEAAGDRAPAGATLHRLDAQGNGPAWPAEPLERLLLREPDAQIGRDRVEPAGVHDAGTADGGLVVVGVDHGTHPLRLTGEVAVIGTGRCDSGHQG